MTLRPSTRSIAMKAIAVNALLFAAHASFAQKGLDMGLRMNIQASALLNTSDQTAGPELDAKINTGVAFGIGGTYMVNSHIGLGVDFLYSKQGQSYKGDASRIAAGNGVPDLSQRFRADASTNSIPLTTGAYTVRRDVTYIKVPIMLRYTSNNAKRLYFSSFIGPQISLLAGAKYKINGQDMNLSSMQMEPKDAYKKMGIDLAFGVGAGVNLSKNVSLALHLRLDYGLGDAEDKGKMYTSGGVSGGTATYYPIGRANTCNATGGGLISFNYKFTKKEKAPEKGRPGAKPAPRPAAKTGVKPAPKPVPKKK